MFHKKIETRQDAKKYIMTGKNGADILLRLDQLQYMIDETSSQQQSNTPMMELANP